MAPKYRKWLDQNAKNIEVDEPLVRDVNVKLVVLGGKGWRMNRDLDNIFKGVMDLLVKNNAIKDDCCKVVRSVYCKYEAPFKLTTTAKVVVHIEGYTDETED